MLTDRNDKNKPIRNYQENNRIITLSQSETRYMIRINIMLLKIQNSKLERLADPSGPRCEAAKRIT